MAISSSQAAKWICEASNWTVSNLELQKLIYLAHMFHMGRHRRPLVSEKFEAWAYGPVLPDLYHHVKGFGSGPVGNVFHRTPDIDDEDAVASLREAYNALRNASPSKLVALTHRDEGAWAKTYEPSVRGKKIADSEILREFKGLTSVRNNQ